MKKYKIKSVIATTGLPVPRRETLITKEKMVKYWGILFCNEKEIETDSINDVLNVKNQSLKIFDLVKIMIGLFLY